MRLSSTTVTLLLAALAMAALLAACAAEEPTAEPVEDPEPDADVAEAEDEAIDDAAAEDEAAADDDAAADEPDEESPGETEEAADAPGEGVEITAYVVAYHWGFAIFDEDGEEVEQLEVPKGATVDLVAVNDHASGAIDQLPDPVADTINGIDWHERAHHAVEAGDYPDPAEAEGVSLTEALDEAHDHDAGLDHHGLMVAGVGGGERLFLDSHAEEPERLEIVADREGVFEFRCTEECGALHDYQRHEKLVVHA